MKIKEKTKYYTSFENNNNDNKIIIDLKNDREILEKQREEKEFILSGYQRIKEMKEQMNMDLQKQNYVLENIEKNVVESEEKKYDKDIDKQKEKGNEKEDEYSVLNCFKHFCSKCGFTILIGFLCFVLGLLIGILI